MPNYCPGDILREAAKSARLQNAQHSQKPPQAAPAAKTSKTCGTQQDEPAAKTPQTRGVCRDRYTNFGGCTYLFGALDIEIGADLPTYYPADEFTAGTVGECGTVGTVDAS